MNLLKLKFVQSKVRPSLFEEFVIGGGGGGRGCWTIELCTRASGVMGRLLHPESPVDLLSYILNERSELLK